MRLVNVKIPGMPVLAVRMTQRGKCVSRQAQRYLGYLDYVRVLARRACATPFAGPVCLRVDVYLREPEKRGADVSNLLKACEDAGNGGVLYQDDRQIVYAIVRVWHGDDDRVEMTVWNASGWGS